MTGHVSIGMPPTVGDILSIPLAEAFKTQHPDATLRIISAYSGFSAGLVAPGRRGYCNSLCRKAGAVVESAATSGGKPLFDRTPPILNCDRIDLRILKLWLPCRCSCPVSGMACAT